MKVELVLENGDRETYPVEFFDVDALYIKDDMYCISVINGHENKITRYPIARVVRVEEWREV